MHTPSMRIPWYLGAPGFFAVVVVAALASNYLGADYFKRTRLEEANPFSTSAGVAAVASTPPQSAAATSQPPASGAGVPTTPSSSPATSQPSAPGAGVSSTPSSSPATSQPTASSAGVATNPSPSAVPTSQSPTMTPAPASGAVVVSQGKFRDGEPGHRGSGTARLGRDAAGKPVLVLEGFSVTNGPDLHVILGTTASGGGQGLDLGKLKATDGTFGYALPDGTDLAQFRSVTIWCASFPTIFAVAELEA